MKQSRLLEIIREEISAALNEAGLGDQITALQKQKDAIEKQKAPLIKKEADVSKKIADLQKKQADAQVKAGAQLEEDLLNEVPDFGGQLDQGVAIKYGEEDTLQNAVDAIVDETLADMGVTLEDLKKDEAKATKALNSIREKVLGAKRKGIPQDPRVAKALKKQQDIEVDKFGGISGKDLQANQTNNAIKKALGLIVPDKRGRPADPNKPEKAPSTGQRGRKPGTKVATRTAGDDGFDTVTYSTSKKDSEEDKAAAAAAKVDKALGGKYAQELSSEDEAKYKEYKNDIDSLVKDLEDKFDKSKMAELRLYLEDNEVRRLFKAKGVKLSDLVRSVIK